MPTFAASQGTTFMSLLSSAVKDAFGNQVNAISSGTAKQASSFISGGVGPHLLAFSMDLNGPTITLTFDIPVQASSFTASGFTLLDSQGSANKYTLTDSTCTSADGAIVVITLSTTDLNAIKVKPNFCKAVANTFLSVLSGAFVDITFNHLGLISILPTAALQVSNTGFTADNVSPALNSYTLNMDSGVLTLTFSEPISSSLTVSAISFQSTVASAAVHYGLTGGVVTKVNQLRFSIALSLTDINGLKATAGLAKSVGSTFLTTTSALCQDYFSNNVAVISSGAAASGMYLPDITPPTLIMYSVDMDANKLTFTFSEPVDATQLTGSAITVQDAASKTVSYTLTSGVGVGSTAIDAFTVSLSLNAIDVLSIKSTSGLLRNQGNSYITFTGAMIKDADGVSISAVSNTNGINANSYNADVTSPQLTFFSLNLNTGLLLLTFNEPVDVSQFTATGFTLQNSMVAPTRTLQLSASTTQPLPPHT